MNDPKWSPGTWTYDPEEAAVVTDHEPHIIAPLFGKCEDADGYLLAAAKDLYAALFMVWKIENFYGQRLIDKLGNGDRAEIQRALAKARGESQ